MSDNLLNMTFNIANPVSTAVHSDIDDLIYKSNLNDIIQKEKEHGVMYADKTPQNVGGMPDFVSDVALSPLLTLKSLGSLGRKILDKTSLKNPVSHFTNQPRASLILDSGKIKATGRFPYSKKSYSKKTKQDEFPKSVSLTRDPQFAYRKQDFIPTTVKFIMDRDDLVKKNYILKPYTDKFYGKVLPYKHTQYGYMNPRFEFEERLLGDIPLKDVKLIDLLNFPSYNFSSRLNLQNAEMLDQIVKRNIPTLLSAQAKKAIGSYSKALNRDLISTTVLNKLMSSPTYKYKIPNFPNLSQPWKDLGL